MYIEHYKHRWTYQVVMGHIGGTLVEIEGIPEVYGMILAAAHETCGGEEKRAGCKVLCLTQQRHTHLRLLSYIKRYHLVLEVQKTSCMT